MYQRVFSARGIARYLVVIGCMLASATGLVTPESSGFRVPSSTLIAMNLPVNSSSMWVELWYYTIIYGKSSNIYSQVSAL